MNRALFVTAALTLGAITTPAMAAQTWMCRVAPGPLFSDVQQCNAFCLETQGAWIPTAMSRSTCARSIVQAAVEVVEAVAVAVRLRPSRRR
ncbi:hypothetical protein BEN78_11705 [Xanthomonas citri pv. mangiferaeindicae]|nr:hypothetical protein BEN78_11705 [Xanthomonas citri pv. mangiferaeindicae]